MGGNIFKTERMSGQEYEDACLFISKSLKHVSYAFPDSFLDKEDFGDIDIICSNPDTVRTQLYNIGCVTNFNDGSLLINHKGKEIQVDFIKSCNVPYATSYYSYGMFGAMIGKLLKSQGFKLNDIGLFYIYNGNDVFVTSDWSKILRVLGIFRCKFTIEEEAFLAIVNSGQFKKSIFYGFTRKETCKSNAAPYVFKVFRIHKRLSR